MANVSCTVYFREHGTSKIHAVEQAKGRVGSYGIRWYEGTRQRQKIIGQCRTIHACFLVLQSGRNGGVP